MVRRAVVLAVFVFFGVTGPVQAAAPANILDGQIPCGVVTDEGSGGSAVSTSLGQDWCGTIRPSDNTSATVTPAIESVRSTAKTTDGVPLDINFAMPDPGTFGPPPYPTLMAFHGYGGNRFSFRSLQRWLDKGYATYSITARGFDEDAVRGGIRAEYALSKRLTVSAHYSAAIASSSEAAQTSGGLRQGLHPPDRSALRDPRYPELHRQPG